MGARALATASLLLILASCARPAVVTARAPLLDSPQQSKCQVVKSSSHPLIVEWPASDRAALEVRAERGPVVVRFAGCEMEVLAACEVPGSYRYSGTTVQQDGLVMRSEDDLYANMPVGAARLAAKLGEQSELDVAMTVVGRLETDRRQVAHGDLKGACAGATHVVSALTVGAFKLSAGARATVHGGASVLGARAGATGSASEEVLNQAGDPRACRRASKKDKEPPEGCGALMRLDVVPLGGTPLVTVEAPRPGAPADHADAPAEKPSARSAWSAEAALLGTMIFAPRGEVAGFSACKVGLNDATFGDVSSLAAGGVAAARFDASPAWALSVPLSIGTNGSTTQFGLAPGLSRVFGRFELGVSAGARLALVKPSVTCAGTSGGPYGDAPKPVFVAPVLGADARLTLVTLADRYPLWVSAGVVVALGVMKREGTMTTSVNGVQGTAAVTVEDRVTAAPALRVGATF